MYKKSSQLKARLRDYFLKNQLAIRYGWIGLRMVWSVVRVTLVLKVFTNQSDSAYLNALLIDMGTSYVEAWATGRALLAFATEDKCDDKSGRWFLLLAAVMFVAPEVLLVIFWNGIPDTLLVGIGVFIACSLGVFLLSMRKKIKACRK
ncbi:MAG: hypothetical protein QG623_177 [Patescibacteria group bacterium]|nr:hypothetical protein [Patescibacteria group bacterium]